MTKDINANTENLQADVVVVGGGGAGLPATLAEAETGAKNIIVLEKMDKPGGMPMNRGASSTPRVRLRSGWA